MPKKHKKKHNSDFLTAPLSRKRAKREIKAVQRLGVGDEQRQIKGEKRATKVLDRRISDWFGEYGDTVGQAKGTTAAAYSTATNSINANSQRSADYAETLRQRLVGEEQADATRRGVAYDPSGSHTSVDANLSRVNAANVLSGVVSSQGATQSAYLTDKKRIGEREKVEQLLRNQERKRSYNTDLRALARRKGDLGITERGRLRSEERDYKLGLMAAVGQKKAAAASAKDSSNYQKFATKQQKRGLKGEARSRKGQLKLARLQAKHGRKDDKRSLKWKDQGKDKKGGASKGTFRKAASFYRTDVNLKKTPRKAAIDLAIRRGGFSPVVARKSYRKVTGAAKKKNQNWWDVF